MKKNPAIDRYLENAKKWRQEMEKLREIALDCGLGEELKWGKPCYTWKQGNVVTVQAFQGKCALLFNKGSLLKDPKTLLERPGPNSHVGRRMVFTSLDEILQSEKVLRAFLAQAKALEDSGQKVQVGRKPEAPPAELEEVFAAVSGLKKAFQALTPGRQRAYLLHFSGAKQSATRTSRIQKCVPMILAGKGMRD